MVAVLALSLAPAASAKFQISLSLSNDEPRMRQAVRAVIRTDERVGRDCRMRLLAVAPGVSKYEALAAFISGGISIVGPSGPSFRKIQPTPRMGFLVGMARAGPKTWSATIRFSRAGRWRLIVPNWCAPGYAGTPPVDRAVAVR